MIATIEPTLGQGRPVPEPSPIICPECGFHYVSEWWEGVTILPPEDWDFPPAWYPEVPMDSFHLLCTQCGWEREVIR